MAKCMNCGKTIYKNKYGKKKYCSECSPEHLTSELISIQITQKEKESIDKWKKEQGSNANHILRNLVVKFTNDTL